MKDNTVTYNVQALFEAVQMPEGKSKSLTTGVFKAYAFFELIFIFQDEFTEHEESTPCKTECLGEQFF